MICLRESEQRLLDGFRSLNAEGQERLLSAAVQQSKYNPAYGEESTSYGNLSEADTVAMMTKHERFFISAFRECNDTGCSLIEKELTRLSRRYRNPEYITQEERLLLEYYRLADAESRWEAISALMNSANRPLVKSHGSCRVVSIHSMNNGTSDT